VAYENAFQKWPEADVFAGPIVPVFEGEPPTWLERALPAIGSAFGMQVVERDGATIEAAAPPYGANYAIRTSVQKQRRYDPALGRGPVGWLRSGEETELLKAVLAGGSSGRWVATALVEHVISPDRWTLGYLWRYYEGYGMLVGVMERTGRPGRLSMVSVLGEMAFAELAYRAARLAASPEHWAVAMVRAAIRRGKWKSRFIV
jgi:glucosyl-dolichyl phosphate glucuronosyltransferase